MIPRLEKGTLRLMFVTACGFAEDGQLADGYTWLLQGLRHAQAIAKGGDPWAAELVAHYDEALEEYVARYSVLIE
jgi:hypothetical protein